MPFTARELINRAYYLSGVVSRRFQSVSGSQATDGFNLLNETLSAEGITGSLIPYYKEYSLNVIAGQETYFIPGLIEVETITFNINTVRYSMSGKGRKSYFGEGRADNIQTLPYEWHIERTRGGSNLYVYFLPDTNYPFKIWGKFALDEISDICDDLLLVYDRFYLKYLGHALAADICNENHTTLPPQTAAELQKLEEKLTYVSPKDLHIQKRSTLQSQGSLNYGDINLGEGWRP